MFVYELNKQCNIIVQKYYFFNFFMYIYYFLLLRPNLFTRVGNFALA